MSLFLQKILRGQYIFLLTLYPEVIVMGGLLNSHIFRQALIYKSTLYSWRKSENWLIESS